jgi:S-DNA-T family DNA segregation ATPase FtsK/SpoIIIE
LLLAGVIGENETGIVATAELADRISWAAKSLGEALRRAGIGAPYPPRQRLSGARRPVSVQDIDTIMAAVESSSRSR